MSRFDRAALMTGTRSRGNGSAASNPLLPAESADPFTARPIDPATVTGTDAERLAAFEDAIERATTAAGESLRAAKARFAIEAGTALRGIQTTRLYLTAGYSSFGDYSQKRWGITRQRAHQLMDAAPVMRDLSKIFDGAPVESHAAALAPVLKEHGEEAVRAIVESAQQAGKLTVAQIQSASERLGYLLPAQEPRLAPPSDRRRRRYGIEDEQYEALMTAQNGACAICKEAFAGKVHTDHSHGTGTVRGLLCVRCNLGLGQFLDNPALLRAAADYLERATQAG